MNEKNIPPKLPTFYGEGFSSSFSLLKLLWSLSGQYSSYIEGFEVGLAHEKVFLGAIKATSVELAAADSAGRWSQRYVSIPNYKPLPSR